MSLRTSIVAAVTGTLLIAGVSAGQAQPRPEWRTDFSKHTVPLDEIMHGGPPKDGVPVLDRPRFVTASSADRWLSGTELVLVVQVEDDVRAYPYRILIWHEIVNDVVGGQPVAVTYCPVCNTALAFDRRQRGHVLTFGVSGMLHHWDMVMFDRETESWWQQAAGEGIVGEFAGQQLALVTAHTVTWDEFREAFPRARVLSQETGFDRPYGHSPYADDRLPSMERVAAVQHAGQTVAYPFSELSRARVVNDHIGDDAVVVFWVPTTGGALETESGAGVGDVGVTGVFRSDVAGRTLDFHHLGEGTFRDRETGSTWNVLGQATGGELAGSRLESLPYGDYPWLTWAVFRPDTRIWTR